MSWIPITDLFARVRHFAKRGDTTLSDAELTSIFKEIAQELKPRMKGAEQLYYEVKERQFTENDIFHPTMGLLYPLETDVIEFLHVMIDGIDYQYVPWERFNTHMCTNYAVTLGKINTESPPALWAAQLSTRNPANVLPGAYQVAVLAEQPYPAYLGITTDQEYYYAARTSGSGFLHLFVPSATAVNEIAVKAYNNKGILLETLKVDTSGLPMPVDVPPIYFADDVPVGTQTFYYITPEGGADIQVGYAVAHAVPGKILDLNLNRPANIDPNNDLDVNWTFDLTDPSVNQGVDLPPSEFNGDSYSSGLLTVTDNDVANSWTREYRMATFDHTNVATLYTNENFIIQELTEWQLSEQIDPTSYITGARSTPSPVMGIYPAPEAGETYQLDIGAWITPWRIIGGSYEIMSSAISIFRNRMLQDVMIMLAWDERAPTFAQAARTALDAYNEDGKIARNRLTKLVVTRADNQTDINEV